MNRDGRTDILTPKGWFEAPADSRSGEWKNHPAWEEKTQLGFLHVIDINGDGRNDVLTSSAHDYGIFWFEQGQNGQFTRRVIDNPGLRRMPPHSRISTETADWIWSPENATGP